MAAVPLQVPSRNAERVPEAAHLACDVVIDAFGHDSGLVAKFLLRRGNRTLRELTRDTVRDTVRPRLTARRHAFTCPRYRPTWPREKTALLYFLLDDDAPRPFKEKRKSLEARSVMKRKGRR